MKHSPSRFEAVLRIWGVFLPSMLLVPRAGLEPARAVKPISF